MRGAAHGGELAASHPRAKADKNGKREVKTLASGASGRLLVGTTHSFSGGLRVSLGSAKESPRVASK